MTDKIGSNVLERADLRDRTHVFGDRLAAGEVLAEMLRHHCPADALVLAVPAGGVPVAGAVAKELGLALDVVVVSKMTPTWNTEVGYGAVACDGTCCMNDMLIQRFGLTEQEVRAGLERAKRKIQRRIERFRGDRPKPDVQSRTVILIDDGLATGYTLRCAIKALHKADAAEIILAIPTAHEESINGLGLQVQMIVCPNIRSGWSFAVADAYVHWSDISEDEAADLLKGFVSSRQVTQPHIS